ncbi:MAG: ATP-binding protein [Alphaproteobacteria bacterium]|nr:ATP-binding protein [Alphaproteobacteria bacterium]
MARLIPWRREPSRLTLLIKRFLPRTLLGRSLMIMVTPLVILQLVTVYVFYDRHWQTMTRRLASSIAGDISMIIDQMRSFPQDEAWALAAAGSHLGLDATFRRGETLPADAPPAGSLILDPVLAKALESKLRRPFHIDTGRDDDKVEINVQLNDGVLHVLAPRKRLWSVTTYIFIMWMVGASVVLFAIAILFMRNQVRPIRRLAADAEQFGKGRDVPDFKPSGALEVRQAATAFNIMRQRILRQLRQRTEMLAGVSHDLRTPLTRMKLELAMLEKSADVSSLKEDLEDMARMVEGYLAFARGEGDEPAEETDLSDLLDEVIKGAERKQIHVDFEKTGNLTVPVRPNAIKRCFTNLVENAATYGRHVSIQARRRGGAVEIHIDDDGPGIPRERRSQVFRPFFRLDKARGPDTGGMGLGLTIARDVARGHGGDITLGDSPAGGLRAIVRLPV